MNGKILLHLYPIGFSNFSSILFSVHGDLGKRLLDT